MSVLKVLAVFDSKVGAYGKPIFARTIGEAMRDWETICNDQKTMMCMHPADFTLFLIAEYDEERGKFRPLESLQSLGSALEAKSQDEIPKNIR